MLPSGYHNARAVVSKLRTSLGRKLEYEEILEALNNLVAKKEIDCKEERYEPDTLFAISIEKRNEIKRK